MRKLKRVLSFVLMLSLMIHYPLAVSAESVAEENAIDNQSGEGDSDSGAYIVVERATGEIETYALEDLLEEAVVIGNDELTVCDSGLYILQDGEGQGAMSVRSVNAHKFDWDIDRNTTVYSTAIMDLSVGDRISFALAIGTKNYLDVQFGLMNRANMAFISNDTLAGTYTYPTFSQSWTMAVGGSFSFAIKNNASADETINFTGNYTY